MLLYLRFFTILSLLAMVTAAGAVSMYFRMETTRAVEDIGQQANIAVARHFNVEIWGKYRGAVASGAATPAFRADMARFVYNAQALGVRLYSARGELLYTGGGTLDADAFTAKSQAAQASSLRVASDLTTSGEASLGGRPLRLVRSVVALGDNGEAFLEIFANVDRAWETLRLLQWLMAGGTVAVFLAFMAMVYLLYLKAETIIARQHERNAELELAAASAQEETQQKSLFLANISHELRTPLNAIIGFSDIIRNTMGGDMKNPQFAGYIGDIHSSGVHLLSLINDILDFSKADAGKLELEVEEVNATKLAANCLRLVEPRAEAAGVMLVNGMPKEPFVLETDSKKFKQVLLNLLSNAVKFTPSGGKVKITGWEDLANGLFLFQVSDTGIGIAQKDIAKAMAAFGQVDSALSRRYEGTGLGLPLTRKFVELMGGKFSIQSELNVGTTVTFSLPRLFSAGNGAIFKRVS